MGKIASFLFAIIGGVGLLAAPSARPAPAAGKDYSMLQTPQPVPVAGGKVEVVEFFGYWCPHCNQFESTWESWVARQSKDVLIRRVPVDFGDPRLVPYSRIYYALEAVGKLDTKSSKGTPMHSRMFDAIHGTDRFVLPRDAGQQQVRVADFMAKEGIDRTSFLNAYNSFGVNSNVMRASLQAKQYGVEGVPTLVVQGKYVVSPDEAGGYLRTLQTLNFLVQQIRAGSM